jgi:drug/metabolite transporter (DMT)-like permease
LIVKAEKFSKRKIVGLIAGILGIVLIMFGKGIEFSLGSIAALVASVTFAFFQVGNKRVVHGVSPYLANTVSFFGCLPAYLVYFLILGQSLAIPDSIWQFENLWRFIYLSLFVSALGYITFIKTVQKLSAVSASVIFLLKPAVATILAIIFLSENPAWNFYIGLILSLLGSLLVLNVKWKRNI